MKSIEFKITPDGKVIAETIGFKGKACQDATKFLEQLGSKLKEEKKPEFYQPPNDPTIEINEKRS